MEFESSGSQGMVTEEIVAVQTSSQESKAPGM